MASTSAEVLRRVQAGGPVSDAEIGELAASDPRELFGELIEPLADSFDSELADAYTHLFSRVLAVVAPQFSAAELGRRHGRLLRSAPAFEPDRVVVLSRVTLGADVAITSTLLAAAAMRWPRAEVCFAGPSKNFELFAGRTGLRLLAAPYHRTGPLAERIVSGLQLAPMLDVPGTLVIDPDSRLSQLGLLPLAQPERTLYMPSRQLGGESDSLVSLTWAFAREVLGVEASPWIAPSLQEGPEPADVAVSFGVGENPGKRVGDAFETGLIQGLLERGYSVLLDSGAPGSGEWDRASRIAQGCGGTQGCEGRLRVWQGSFAAFAAAVGRSRWYIGYDSAGQHVAAACGVPRVTVFNGYPNRRFLARWRPEGSGESRVVLAGPDVLNETMRGL